MYLLPGRIVGRNQGAGVKNPARRIDWIDTGQYWLSPNYHYLKWEKAVAANPTDVRRIDLNAGKILSGHWGGGFSLPSDFSQQLPNWPNLMKLNLSSHLVHDAWTALLEVQTLEELSLRQCSLQALPAGINRLSQLTHLDLSDNQIEKLPKTIYRMQHLEELKVAGNPLPPETILRLQERLPNTKIVHKHEW